MTKFVFYVENERVVGFQVSEHSGYAEEGSDIVCAAVSSVVNLIDATVNQVLGLSASVNVNEKNTLVSFHLPGGLSELDDATCQNLMAGAMVYLADLHQNYPDNLDVIVEYPDDDDVQD